MRCFRNALLLLLAVAAIVLARTAASQTSPAPAAPASAPGQPRLEIEKEVVDLGNVVRGGKADATFVLRNTGKEVLRILSAKPG